MKYRVILKVGYSNAWFDFDNLNDAGEFAKVALTHSIGNDDTHKYVDVSIKCVNPETEKEEEDD